MTTRKETNNPRWPGYIVMPSYMKFPALISWEEAIDTTKSLKKSVGIGEFYKSMLPAAISFVEEWHIIGLNENEDGSPILDKEGKPIKVDYCNFPASAALVSFLVECVSSLYTETNRTDPN